MLPEPTPKENSCSDVPENALGYRDPCMQTILEDRPSTNVRTHEFATRPALLRKALEFHQDWIETTLGVVIGSAIAELERSLIVERVRAGMRRAKPEGRRIGRTPLDVDRAALVRDRLSGISLTVVAKKYGLSRASVVRFVRESQIGMVHRAADPG